MGIGERCVEMFVFFNETNNKHADKILRNISELINSEISSISASSNVYIHYFFSWLEREGKMMLSRINRGLKHIEKDSSLTNLLEYRFMILEMDKHNNSSDMFLLSIVEFVSALYECCDNGQNRGNFTGVFHESS